LAKKKVSSSLFNYFSFDCPSKWQKGNCSLSNSAHLFLFGKNLFSLATTDWVRLIFIFVAYHTYNHFYLLFRLNPTEDLITLPLRSLQQKSVLVTGECHMTTPEKFTVLMDNSTLTSIWLCWIMWLKLEEPLLIQWLSRSFTTKGKGMNISPHKEENWTLEKSLQWVSLKSTTEGIELLRKCLNCSSRWGLA
jgi:hypothetical protein